MYWKKTTIIMRGFPGSGKSYKAKNICKIYGGDFSKILSTDDWFIQSVKDEDEETKLKTYRENWNFENLGKAHLWNFNRFKELLLKGASPLIIDNTNVKYKDFKNYANFSIENEYNLIFMESDSNWWKDHRNMLYNKGRYETELDEFSKLLSGEDTKLKNKYNGFNGNSHGVSSNVIRNMINKWENLEEINAVHCGTVEKCVDKNELERI